MRGSGFSRSEAATGQLDERSARQRSSELQDRLHEAGSVRALDELIRQEACLSGPSSWST